MLKSGFNNKVWAALKLIPEGRITTYKAIAEFIGKPKAARAVGNACNKNSDAPKVACHRVIKSDWTLGGYAGGVKQKMELLEKEGIKIANHRVEDFKKKQFRFK